MTTEDKYELKKAWLSFLPALIFVSIMWGVKAFESLSGIRLSNWGTFPHKADGLWGILFSPFLHGGLEHLVSNTAPLLMLATSIFYFYKQSAWKIISIVWIGSGILVWLFARPSYHIGASGLIYGFAAFLFTGGFIKRNNALLAISLLVSIFYGGMVWGVLPLNSEISWESHVGGVLMGMLCAWTYRHEGPESSYLPIEEDDNEPETGYEYWNVDQNVPPPFKVGEEEE